MFVHRLRGGPRKPAKDIRLGAIKPLSVSPFQSKVAPPFSKRESKKPAIDPLAVEESSKHFPTEFVREFLLPPATFISH